MSQNRELAAGNGDGRVFLQSGAIDIFPEVVLRTCTDYRPVDDSEPVARAGAARAGNLAGL